MKTKRLIPLILLMGIIALTGCNKKDSKEEGKATKGKFDVTTAGDQYLKAIEEGVFYEEEATTPEGTVFSKVWMKGDKVKRITPSQNAAMIINGDRIVSYDLTTKQGYLIQDEGDVNSDEEFEDETESENYYEDMTQDMIDSMTEEEYNGQTCMVTEMTAEGSSMKLWINKDTGFFVRMEMLTGGSLISAVEYKNVKFGNIADSEFEVPADVVITDMNSLMEGMEANMDMLMDGLGEGLF